MCSVSHKRAVSHCKLAVHDLFCICRFLWVPQPLENQACQWDQQLSAFMVSGESSLGENQSQRMIEHILAKRRSTLQEQVSLLTSISNFHWWVGLAMDGTKLKKKPTPAKHQFLLSHPGQTQQGDVTHTQHLPSSPRNQLLYFFSNGRIFGQRFMDTLEYVLQLDREGFPAPGVLDVDEGSEPPRPPKRSRRYQAREITLSPGDFFESMSLDSDQVSQVVNNLGDQDRGLFRPFSEDLVSHGLLQIRRLCDTLVIVAMSDYCEETGKLLPLKFVHVTASMEHDQLFVKCTCKIYLKMSGAALKHLQEEEDVFLGQTFTCMHCSFYRKFIHQDRSNLFHQNSTTNTLAKLQETADRVNNPVVLLGPASTSFTTKFSVVGEDSCALVHINFVPGAMYAKCQNGLCQAKLLNRKKIPKVVSRGEKLSEKFCCHLQTLFANMDILEELFPNYFFPQEEEGQDSDSVPQASTQSSELEENRDDFMLSNMLVQGLHFNKASGLWEIDSLSRFTPMEMTDPDLVHSTGHRLTYIRPDNLTTGGMYLGPALIPPLKQEDGSPKMCPCGSGFTGKSAGQVQVLL